MTASTPSPRALRLPASPLRELLKSAADSNMLNLAGGIPDPTLFPSRVLARAAEKSFAQPWRTLQYMPSEGDPELRSWIAGRLALRGVEADLDQVLITCGGQNGLALAAQLSCSEGTRAFVECPGYPGAHQAFALAGAQLHALKTTATGWEIPGDLRERDVMSVTVACVSFDRIGGHIERDRRLPEPDRAHGTKGAERSTRQSGSRCGVLDR